MNFKKILKETKLIAILRGIRPHEVITVADILISNGFKIIEVPLNSPNAFLSISTLVEHYKNSQDIVVGAGTVCQTSEVEHLASLGAQIIISPNTSQEVISSTKENDLVSIPGFVTPSEAYSAIGLKADCLKLFPFDNFGISYYKNIKTILPQDAILIAVGGINEHNIKKYINHGICYFGLGSSLYQPNMSLDLLREKAKFFMQTVQKFSQC